MPVTQVKTPSGEMISVNHPEGATSESILRFAAASQGVKPQASVAPDPARDLLSPSLCERGMSTTAHQDKVFLRGGGNRGHGYLSPLCFRGRSGDGH